MTLRALLDEIRNAYVSHLANIIAREQPCHAEPALRLQDGSLALEGTLGLPYRTDIVRKADGSTLMVKSPSVTRRKPVRVLWSSSLETEVEGFSWDLAIVEITSVGITDWSPLKAWFLRWFDPEDEKAEQTDKLSGVVHFLSDPFEMVEGLRIQIDFGSAPIEAFEEMLDSLVAIGAKRVVVKREPSSPANRSRSIRAKTNQTTLHLGGITRNSSE